jgi:hypothetical protein
LFNGDLTFLRLAATVNYTRKDGEKKTFKKYFKFPVTSPIGVKTQTHDLQHGLFLTAQITNVTPNPLFLESVRLDPSNLFHSVELNGATNSNAHPHVLFNQLFGMNSPVSKDNLLETIIGEEEVPYLKAGDVRQYLFKLEPKNPHDPRIRNATTVGKVEVLWRASMGETGKLSTVLLERRGSPKGDIELIVRSIPQKIELEKPFSVQLEITNRTDRTLLPRLLFNKTPSAGVSVNEISGGKIGKIISGNTKSVPLTLFPSKPGVQKITGLQIMDDKTQRIYDFNDVFDVLVE